MKSEPTKKLGEICEINPVKSETKNISDDVIVSFVPMSAVSEYSQRIEDQEERIFGDVKKGYTYFKRGDILFAKITPCMENGKAALADNLEHEIGFASTEFHVIRAGKDVLSKYIFLLISSKKFREEAQKKMTGSAGQKRVPKSFLENYEISLPPLAEQKKIVARVEKLLAKVKEAKRLRGEARAAAQSLLSAELHKIFSEGKKKGWEEKKVGNIATLKSGITIPKEWEKEKGDIPYIKVSGMNIPSNYLVIRDAFSYVMRMPEVEKMIIPPNSVIFPKRGGAIATNKKRLVESDILIDLNTMAVVCPPHSLDAKFFYYWFLQIDLATLNTGSSVPQINNGQIAPLEIPLPSLAEQKKIVARLDVLSAKLKKLEEYQKSADLDLARLEQSILHQAFSR